jgi:hypothetical protein
VLLDYATRPHFAICPRWICGQCDANWPCAVARDQQLAGYRSTPWALPEYAVFLMDRAAEELRTIDRVSGQARRLSWETLYRRFVSWTWPTGTSPPTTLSTRTLLSWLVDPGAWRAAERASRSWCLVRMDNLDVAGVRDDE